MTSFSNPEGWECNIYIYVFIDAVFLHAVVLVHVMTCNLCWRLIGWLHLSERIKISDELYLYTKDLEFLVLIMYKENHCACKAGWSEVSVCMSFNWYRGSGTQHLITNSQVKTLGLLSISLEFMYQHWFRWFLVIEVVGYCHLKYSL